MAVKKRKSDAWLEAIEFMADNFEKEIVEGVTTMPEKGKWWAFGPGLTPEEATLLVDSRKLVGFDRISKLPELPEGAVWGIVFW